MKTIVFREQYPATSPRGASSLCDAPTQRQVYAALMRVPGRVVPVEEIIAITYGMHGDGGPRAARDCVYTAIHKLRKCGAAIERVSNRGYVLTDNTCFCD